MFWCDECRAVIHCPVRKEGYGVMWNLCPTCGGPLSDAALCDCGKWTDPNEIFCEDCWEFIKNIGLILATEYDVKYGRVIDREHLRDLAAKWLEIYD